MATIPADVLRDLADSFDRDADANLTASRHAEDDERIGHFKGKADGYRTAAERLREYADGAEKDA